MQCFASAGAASRTAAMGASSYSLASASWIASAVTGTASAITVIASGADFMSTAMNTTAAAGQRWRLERASVLTLARIFARFAYVWNESAAQSQPLT